MAIEGVSATGLEAQSSQTDAVKSLIRWESPHPLSIAGVTGETLEQSREERGRRGRKEGTQSEEEVDAEARPGHSAGFGVSQEASTRGSKLNGPPKPRTSITFDLRQEPGAGKPHAGI